MNESGMRRKKDVPVSGMKIESGREGYWQTSVRVKEREDFLKRGIVKGRVMNNHKSAG